MTPSCPLFVAAAIAGERRHLAWSTAKPECIGSACAWWWFDSDINTRSGRCGITHAAQSFEDPAQPTKPKP